LAFIRTSLYGFCTDRDGPRGRNILRRRVEPFPRTRVRGSVATPDERFLPFERPIRAILETGYPSEERAMTRKVMEVKARVLSVKGQCDLGHKVGDVVRFTQTGVDGKICIHALYSMLPKVFAMMFNAEFPWAQNPDVLTHPCPDAANPVVFELTRIYED
jgi:uncharacterized repeat protein (TIGR04076 family)